MGSKILLTGNVLALLVTIAAFLQQLSWPSAGLLTLTVLIATILLHANSKKVEASIPPALRAITPPILRPRERQALPAQAQAVPVHEPMRQIPAPIAHPQSTPTPAASNPTTSPAQAQVEQRENPSEAPTLIEKGDYLSFDLDLDAGKEVVGKVSADGLVNVYVMTEENLASIDAGEEFWSETCEEGAEEATVKFTAPESGTWFLVVENADVKDVTASVKIHVDRPAKNTGPDRLVPSFESLKIDAPK